MGGYQMISNILSKLNARFKRRWVAAYMCFLFCTTSFSVISEDDLRSRREYLAEAEVFDSSDNFSQAAHRLCVGSEITTVASCLASNRTNSGQSNFYG